MAMAARDRFRGGYRAVSVGVRTVVPAIISGSDDYDDARLPGLDISCCVGPSVGNLPRPAGKVEPRVRS